jgi:nitrogen fixation/metabolism regulation signal transduction histidine kinase
VRRSLEGEFALLCCALAAAAIALAVVFSVLLDSFVVGSALAFAATLLLALWSARRLLRPFNRSIAALADGVASFQDGDFSISIAADRDDELGVLVRHYNEAGSVLRRERQNLYQRELLLDTVMQSMPWALILTNAADRVIYSNIAARQLFNAGRKFEGHAFADVLARAPAPFRDAVARPQDGMFSVRRDEEGDVYFLTRESFTLNVQRHQLYLFKQLTRELNRQEVAIWKKVIRVISHELNNSLAPFSSLALSGRQLAQVPDAGARLDSALATIEERAAHLKSFIDGYARFAKLPVPRLEDVDWHAFVDALRQVTPFTLGGTLPDTRGRFDPAQLQQVLINLLRNAHESGSPADAVTLAVSEELRGVRLEIVDRGPGMSPEVLEQALLPFYSTKQTGTGLGLTLCREIVEAHGGRLSLMNRTGGGLRVTIWLP